MESSRKIHPRKQHGTGRPKKPRHETEDSKQPSSSEPSKAAEGPPVNLGPLWGAIERSSIHNPSSTTVLVVNPNETRPLVKMLKRKKRDKECAIKCRVIITEEKNLQQNLNAVAKACTGDKMAELHIYVSSTINCITYHISRWFKKVFIGPCSVPTYHNLLPLRITSASTYHGFPTYAWDRRPDDIRSGGHHITHSDGCYFDINDRLPEAADLLSPRPIQDLQVSNLACTEIKGQFEDLARELSTPSPSPSQLSGNEKSHPGAPDAGWLRTWTAILFNAFRLLFGQGFAGLGVQFYLNRQGIFMKGCAGISLALGGLVTPSWRSDGVKGTEKSGLNHNTILSAVDQFYFVPWANVIAYLKKALWKIWERIWSVVNLVWEKIKALATGVIRYFRTKGQAKDIVLV